MKKLIAVLLLVSLFLGAVACIGAPSEVTTSGDEGTSGASPENTTNEVTDEPTAQQTTAEETTEEESTTEILDKSKRYNFLFVGNSYTHYNTMPESIFGPIMKAAGYNVYVKKVTKGGWYLIDSANSNDEVGAQVDTSFKTMKYNYVILQEQSTCPASTPGKFYDGVRALAEKVRANGAEPILYGTWGRKKGHSVLADNGWTNESMTWMISAAYEAIGAELDIPVAFAGLAFYDVYTNHSAGLNIYDDDLTHPSYAGSYLAAMTIFAKITGIDPTTVDYDGSLTAEAAAILKEAARKAVFETPAIPESYKTKSEGVKYDLGYTVDASGMKNLTSFPTTPLISVLTGGTYPNGKSFSGILGTKNAIASNEYSTTGLSDAQKADIADIGYGVSVIGVEKMDSSSKGYKTSIENFVNGHWGSTMMANFVFGDKTYNIKGEVDENSDYIGLITLNFGSKHKFDAMGFSSGSLKGFPGVAEVYVSDDGVNWTKVRTACWDNVNGTKLVSCGKTPADPWNANTASVTCLFDMEDVTGQYIRIGVIIGRNDDAAKYNTINTREILVYGEKIG